MLVKYYAIKHLILLKIYNIKEVFQWSINYKFFDKNTSGNGIKNENIPNKELAEGLQKPIIRTFNKRKVYSPFTDKIWVADLADVQLINKFDKRFRFLLCVIDIYSKYAWVIPKVILKVIPKRLKIFKTF